MNILAGVYTKDGGQVQFNGKPLDNSTVAATERAGIAFVHQELNLFNDLKVYENIFLRKEITGTLGILDKRAMIQQTRQLFERLGVEIDPCESVSELETGQKQLLEISKALHANAELFILDEPTTALNNEEIDHLFTIVRRLKETGKSFIFISHKMNEIFALADRYTVLRNGERIQSGAIADVTPRDVTRMMVGEGYSEKESYRKRELGEPILELKGLSGPGFHDVDLCIRRGEVVGFTGLVGSGISELFQTVFGALPIESGHLKVAGTPVTNNTIHRAMRNKISMIAANRKENSIIPDFSLLENSYVSEHALSGRCQHIFKKKELEKYMALQEKLNIKANSPDDRITSLSGGNQQKVILARWLNTQSDILLMDNPTQGIDVGAKSEIYRLIQDLAMSGKTVLVNTLEIPEIQQVADRCVIFYHGSIQAQLSREEITEEAVMLQATNAVNTAEVLH
jgi:ribose transport system ATP-binding protein